MAWGKRREGGGCSTPAGGHRVWEGRACGLASPSPRALVDLSRAFACSLRRPDVRPTRVSATELESAAEDCAGEEEETEEERCWVCLEGERKGPLVQLCACRGSSKWSHRACVEYWRRNSDKEDAAYRCGTCKDYYRDALSLELLSARLQAERTDGEDTCYTLDALAWELYAQGVRTPPLYQPDISVIYQRPTDNALSALYQD